MIDQEFLAIVRCPQNGDQLMLASVEIVEQVNRAIQEKSLLDMSGQTVEKQLDGGLINTEGSILYPIRDEIVTLIVDQGINLEQLNS